MKAGEKGTMADKNLKKGVKAGRIMTFSHKLFY